VSVSVESDRFQVVLDLAAAGEAMMRQNLRRRFPDAPDDEIERRLTEWFLTRPGAEHGDGAGRLGTWPRR
jgi:hypothetical protein